MITIITDEYVGKCTCGGNIYFKIPSGIKHLVGAMKIAICDRCINPKKESATLLDTQRPWKNEGGLIRS